MTLVDYLDLVWRHVALVVTCVLVAVVAAAVWSATATPVYSARSSVYFTVAAIQTQSQLTTGLSFVQRQILSYTRLAESGIVLEPVVAELGLATTADELATRVSAQAPLNTVIVQITVRDPSPTLASEIAEAIAARVSTTVADLSPSLEDGVPALAASVLGPATRPTVPTSPNTRLNLVVFALAGLIAGLTVAVAVDSSRRNRARRGIAGGLRVLRMGLGRRRLPWRRRQIEEAPPDLVLQVALGARPAAASESCYLLVTGARRADDVRSAARLLLDAADPELRTLLIDADPDTAAARSDDPPGLTAVLLGLSSVTEAVRQPDGSRHEVLDGASVAGWRRLVDRADLRALRRQALADHDLVVVVSAPATHDTTRLLASGADAVVVVLDAERSGDPVLVEIRDLMAIAGAPDPTLVLTR